MVKGRDTTALRRLRQPSRLRPVAGVAVTHFSDRLADAVGRKRSQLVVGLDPVVERLPAELDGDIAAFCCGIVDAVAEHSVAVKPQSAFFEALGADGVRAFEEVC